MPRLEVTIDPTPAMNGARKVKRSLDDIKKKSDEMEARLKKAGRDGGDGLGRISKAGDMARASLGRLAAAAGPLAAALGAAFSVREIFQFQDALAEVSTLVNTATFNMEGLADAALDQSRAFGGTATQQTKAYYQVISAGASTAAEATETLTAANKLAVGGVTEVQTAADGLTSVLNAYGDQVESATAVSDSMFIAMRNGKTTIGELSGSLGTVAPLAAQTGVSFDELTASIAALTKGGIQTSEAVTGVRAILAAVAKPTSEATKLADQLGLEFNSAALEAQGLAGFLETLVQKTGGSTDALSQLFGGVEALVPVMALSGQAGEDFAATLEDMSTKAGATQDAFDKMANSPGFQAGRVWSALQAEVLATGGALGQALVPVLRTVADNMENLFRITKLVGVALAAAFAPAIFGAIVSGFTTMAAAGVTAVRLIGTAIAANPLGALLVGITTALAAIYLFRDEIKQAIGIDVVEISRNAMNTVIGAFKGAFDASVVAWQAMPQVLGDIVFSTTSTVIDGVERMVNGAIDRINAFTQGARGALSKIGIEIGNIQRVDLGGIDNPYAGALGKATEDIMAAFQNAQGVEYIGALSEALGDAQSNASGTTEELAALAEKLNGGGSGGVAGAADDAAKEAEKLADAYSDITTEAERFIAKQRQERSLIGVPEEQANALRYEMEMLNKASDAGIDLTASQRAEISGLATNMASAEAKTKLLTDRFAEQKKATESLAKSLEQTLGSAVTNLFTGPIEDLGDAMDRVLGSFSQLGTQNLNSLFDGMFSGPRAANDNTGADPVGNALGELPAAVQAGAEAGAGSGSFGGLMAALGKNSGYISAGLGGLGIGYSSQSPLMGALGGAMQGWAAGAAMGSAGGPIGAVIGGLGGHKGGPIYIRRAKPEAKAA